MRKKEFKLTKKNCDGGNHGMTVGKLKEFLNKHNLPDDARIFVQRIPDYYYLKGGWGTKKKLVKEYWGAYKTEYTQIHWAVKYNNENELFLDLHY
jgi:hypothetical protein